MPANEERTQSLSCNNRDLRILHHNEISASVLAILQHGFTSLLTHSQPLSLLRPLFNQSSRFLFAKLKTCTCNCLCCPRLPNLPSPSPSHSIATPSKCLQPSPERMKTKQRPGGNQSAYNTRRYCVIVGRPKDRSRRNCIHPQEWGARN